MNKRIECVISGRVQMVMFRDFVTRKARALKLTGYVENMPDGTVHAVAEGDEERLKDLIVRLHNGSVLSRVDAVLVTWIDAIDEFTTFKIKYK